MRKATLLFLLLIGYAETSSAQLFGPRNYEDCIIEGMQGVSSDFAAVAVQQACRSKFPLNPPNTENDFEGTCIFVYEELTGDIKRITPDEERYLDRERLISTYILRDGATDEQLSNLGESLKQADRTGDSETATALANAIRQITKELLYPKELPRTFVNSLRTPYCAIN